MKLQWPLPDNYGPSSITQLFGENPDDYAKFGLAGHNGIDIGVPVYTPVTSPINGICTPSFDSASYGFFVTIANVGVTVLLGHLAMRGYCGPVVIGDNVGLSGNTGNSTGPHLHLGLKDSSMPTVPGMGNWIDPWPFLVFDALSDSAVLDKLEGIEEISFNPEAALYRRGMQSNMFPVTSEYGFRLYGHDYVAQKFREIAYPLNVWVLYAVDSDWGTIHYIRV